MTTEPDVVTLQIPADGELLMLARLVTAAVAARADFSVDQIEDLRLAVDELCLSVMGEGAGRGELCLQLTKEPDAVHISCTYVGFPGHLEQATAADPGSVASEFAPGVAVPELSSRILDALVDEHAYHKDGNERNAWFRKLSRPAETGRP